MITPDQLRVIFPYCGDPATWAAAISRAWQRFGFETITAQAGFLAVVGNETGGLVNCRRENMAYSPARAVEVFSKAKAHPDIAADRIAKGSMAFANWIYAGIIGNGDEASGDGWRFRGGGIPQLTGRANYEACGRALGVDLVGNPDLIGNDPDVSAAAAAWFMAKYRPSILPLLAQDDEAAFLAGAKLVGATDETATQRRLNYRRKALTVLNAAPDERPRVDPPRPAVSPAPSGPARAAPSWLEGLVALLRSIFVRRA